MKKVFTLWAIIIFNLPHFEAKAQDPALPSVNLGLTNLQAGTGKNPGWSYLQYLQVYRPNKFRDANGSIRDGEPMNSSISSLHQLVYRSPVIFFKGQLGGSVLLPFAFRGGPAVRSVNPNPVGDLLVGPFLEWGNGTGSKLHVRFGINTVFATGAFDSRYALNPGAGLSRLFPHLECTYTPAENFAVSVKDNYYIFFSERGTGRRPAPAHALNYAVEFKLCQRLSIAGAGYYLAQTGQDSYRGDGTYYADRFGITDTRESVAGAGPGIGFRTPGGVFIELKSMWEFGARNRSQGVRGTTVVSIPL